MTANLPPAESVFELSYGVQARQWLMIRPDAQYILDPRAFRLVRERGALALGIQIKMQF
ncbi:MAG: carbohydrate porin [Terracidiphilus sp.]